MIRSFAIAIAALAAAACNRSEAQPTSTQVVTARRAADMVHAVLAADREVYTANVIQRLTKVQKVQVIDPERGWPAALEASEEWKSEHGRLPLPAQMFRMGAEQVLASNTGLSYLLLSPWPVNRQNRPRTSAEKAGLERVTRGGSATYTTEKLDGKSYFVAIYPDVAVAQACADCHNAHPDSPRRDFAQGDVMGGVVIRIALE